MKTPEWSSTFDLGVNELDHEHRDLFDLVGEVRSAIEAHDYRRCHVMSGRFIDALGRHFAHEEAFLARIGFPGIERHRAYHLGLMSEAEALRTACDMPGDGQLMDTCYERMIRCLMEDVVRGDSEFKSYVDYHDHKDVTSDAVAEQPSSGARDRPKSPR